MKIEKKIYRINVMGKTYFIPIFVSKIKLGVMEKIVVNRKNTNQLLDNK